jgi:solute carrier family 39 (zinc transporter), member 1/2/3
VPLIYYKIIAAILIFFITLIAVFYPLKARKHLHKHHLLDFGDAFASGVFLGAALLHMLPEAANQYKALFPEFHYPLAGLLCACGFLLLLFLERLSVSKSKNYSTIPYVLGIIIIIHSFIEGAVLGINTDFSALSIIFIAVIAHKGSESFALSITLSRATLTFTPVLILITVFTLMTPFGIIAGSTLHSFLSAREGQLITAGFNAFAAGTFLYMSTLHHIHHHQRLHEAESLTEFLCLFFGVGIMALIAWWG